MTWGTPQEVERRRRIIVSIWAYAYELANPPQSLVPDHIFDAECYMLAAGLRIDTDRLDLDYWFRGCFDPSTGVWIHKHPELDKIERLFHANQSLLQM